MSQPDRRCRLIHLLALALILGLGQLALPVRAEQPSSDQVQLVDVPGLGPLMLVGPSRQQALDGYVRGLTRRRIYSGEASLIRSWAAGLQPGFKKRSPSIEKLRRGDRPVVGIQLNSDDHLLGTRALERDHAARRIARAVKRAGGNPVFLPPGYTRSAANTLLNQVDHLVLTGGADLHPSLYGQRNRHARNLRRGRDRYEVDVVKLAMKKGLGIDGICRGMQLLNVVHGGSLYQDIHREGATKQMHRKKGFRTIGHRVWLEPESSLARCVGKTCIVTRSTHHQAVRRLGRGLRVTGRTADGLVEAIESPGGWIKGYQFHPESSRSAASRAIFSDIVRRARITSRTRGRRGKVPRIGRRSAR
jgi:putative glutamine amidotransferase